MAYSSDTDLLKEISLADLARLTGDTTGHTVDTDRTAYARENADATIDAYLCGRYNVPFTGDIDLIIKKASIDLTISNLYDFAYCKSTVPSTISWRKINAVKMLKDIKAGDVALVKIGVGNGTPPAIISNKKTLKRYTKV
jgi:phage gp36-like protein